MKRISLSILIALLIPLQLFSQQKIVSYRVPIELPATVQTGNLREGGRANTAVVNWGRPNELFVASDSGGLFESTDWGVTWSHVDGLPVYFTQSVVYLSTDTLLVSAKADFKAANGGGVWRSDDGGLHWRQLTLSPPDPTKRLSAYEISEQGNYIAVGASDGVYFSRDGGLTFEYTNPYSTPRPLYSVLVTGNHILAAGPGGMRIGTITPLAITWTVPSAPPQGSISGIHAFGRSPVSQLQAFVATNTSLWATSTNGMQWGRIPGPPGQPPGVCGTPPFVKTGRRTAELIDLYYGTGCTMYHLPATFNVDDNSLTGNWRELILERVDDRPRDVALIHEELILLASNGGIQKLNDDGVHLRFVGGGWDGYNAVQATELKGQSISSADHTDLYVATRDNHFWAADVGARIDARLAHEAYFVDAERRLFAETSTRITWAKSNPVERLESGWHFSHPTSWNDPLQSPNDGTRGVPVLLQGDRYIQRVTSGLDVTSDAGEHWDPFARFVVDPRGQARVARIGAGNFAIVYQSFKENLTGPPAEGATRLMRIRFSQGDGFVVYPGMTGFGGLGLARTPAAIYPVYGVDSRNAYHVIAPDIINDKMMETSNGGEEWHEIPALTALITNGDKLLFHADLADAEAAPLVTAVSFSPDDPKLVLIGTREGGIYMSGDRGKTWSRITNSEKIPWVTAFHWQDANTIYLSTYGRGLWKLQNTQFVLPGAFGDFCSGCDVVANDGSRGPKFDDGLLAFDGQILGVRTEKGVLREVFVTSRSSVVFAGDPKDLQNEITITRTSGKDTGEPLPKGPDGSIATGVVFTSDHTLTGAAFAKSELTLLPPEFEGDFKGSTESPTAGRPYIRLISSAFNGVPTVTPREVFTLSGTDFAAGESYEVLVDGVAVADKITADAKGALTTRLAAPSEPGYHHVSVRIGGKETVMDASTLLVTESN